MIKLKIDTKDADSIRTALLVAITLGVDAGIIDPALAGSLVGGKDTEREALDEQQAATHTSAEEKAARQAQMQSQQAGKAVGDMVHAAVPSTVEEKPAEVSLEMLRTELAKKVGAHRPALVAKLNELGAKNLTLLSEDKYAMMYDFMICLSDG